MNFSPLIEAHALASSVENRECIVLDCRFDLAAPKAGREAFLEAHIPGAHYADLNGDLSAPPTASSGRHPLPTPQRFVRTLQEWGIDVSTSVVAYDANNSAMAARAWWMLRWMGIKRAQVLNGGFAAWREMGGMVESGPAKPAARSGAVWAPQARGTEAVSVEEVQRRLLDPASRLVDARLAARFSGQSESIDPVAGHVPGAINAPFNLNLDASGRFLDPAVLRRRWVETLGGSPASAVMSMCGSGVTACHNLLALEAAGLPGGKLYVGSWSEWIRDGARPVAREP